LFSFEKDLKEGEEFEEEGSFGYIICHHFFFVDKYDYKS
jgi:hypothetical protein